MEGDPNCIGMLFPSESGNTRKCPDILKEPPFPTVKFLSQAFKKGTKHQKPVRPKGKELFGVKKMLYITAVVIVTPPYTKALQKVCETVELKDLSSFWCKKFSFKPMPSTEM